MRIYAIGDIHGHYDKLRDCHALIAKDRERTGDMQAEVVHLGDYTDRGPKSRDVLEYLIAGIAGGAPWRVLKGNHDRMFQMFLADPIRQDSVLRKEYTWLHERLGGRDTLASYGFANPFQATPEELWSERKKIPQSHVTFLGELETKYENDTLILVHAGLRPGVPISEQSEDDILWIRQEFHSDMRDHGKLVVHGHTPVEVPTHYGNRINLDTGAGYGRPITVAVFEGTDCWVLSDAGRVRLTPD